MNEPLRHFSLAKQFNGASVIAQAVPNVNIELLVLLSFVSLMGKRNLCTKHQLHVTFREQKENCKCSVQICGVTFMFSKPKVSTRMQNE